ncbi:PucR family transcriptional regulator ligand-binding domain-containing protein [Tissierella sp. MSJ-40]|uniref:PucR family transcriptional regulator ligand-binding domain-containing protein n=1 Tax=Tissierella simiarum TaxID=2841534 RepID=A0ABS6E2N1_9FIRM|nr:PucR family transcriptional regulator [Tissierella simiarum]MBU5436524.1 PucR family transcriptional regulator ligand-binding domain-containing protein [Tissierella simiarum]
MGIKIGEILKTKFFSDYHLIAGEKGLDRETQAVALFDAPDGYKWFKGKELVLSSGYLFKDDIKLFKDVIIFLHSKNSTGMAIKTDRYLNEIPEEIINLCNDLGFPLINIPYNAAWIDIINAVNSIAMNSYITYINDKKNADKLLLRSDNFHKKIEKTIINLSEEINYPISIFDILEKEIFTFPINHSLLKDDISFNKGDDFSFNYQKEVLCDKLNIYRIKNIEDKSKCPFIIMPIVIKGVTVSKLIVWEECNEIDYYDLFSLRLSYTLLLEIYEQIYLMNSFERRFYDDLIKDLINGELDTKQKLIKAMNSIQDFKLNIENKFICICIKQDENNPSFYNSRETISTTFLLNIPKDKSIFGILDDNTIIIIYDVEEHREDIIENVKKTFEPIFRQIKTTFSDREIKLGIGDMVEDICSIKKSYIGSLKAVDIGSYIYPDGEMISFEDLGPFGLLRLENIQRKNFSNNFSNIYPLLKEPNSEELISTLKVYLESESNCNIAAKKLFIHSNTVRYRIAKIQQTCNIDLEDPIERLKIEITLKFIDILK